MLLTECSVARIVLARVGRRVRDVEFSLMNSALQLNRSLSFRQRMPRNPI